MWHVRVKNLRTKLRNIKSQLSSSYSFRDHGDHTASDPNQKYIYFIVPHGSPSAVLDRSFPSKCWTPTCTARHPVLGKMYITGRRTRFRPHNVYIYLIRTPIRVELAMSVCPSASNTTLGGAVAGCSIL